MNIRLSRWLHQPIAVALLMGVTLGQHVPTGPAGSRGLTLDGLRVAWSSRHVEHLFNRAGFGASVEEIEHWVPAGPEALVDHFLDAPLTESFRYRFERVDRIALSEADDEQRRTLLNERRQADRRQRDRFLDWWLQGIVDSREPLIDRMALFWHGHFTSSFETVRHSALMIQQIARFRREGLGSFKSLLREMLHDPAMLIYLDNDANREGSPNENLAREVMELFTLGVGNYTEQDVSEAARALTGYTVGDQVFVFRKKTHDLGRKKILGIRGRHDADDLVEILLDQEACGLWIASRVLEYFEGVPASDLRIARYAALLRDAEFEFKPMLRALFLDPYFYSGQVVGAKVLSPVDYLVGISRRLGVQPPARACVQVAESLGQELMEPPNVKGWERGMGWLGTSTLMQRGNVAGALLGLLQVNDIRSDDSALAVLEDMDADEALEGTVTGGMLSTEAVGDAMSAGDTTNAKRVRAKELRRFLRALKKENYKPHISLIDALGEQVSSQDVLVVRGLCSHLLGIEAPPETIAMLGRALARERADKDVPEGSLGLNRRKGEYILLRMAHLILSLPEAQLG